MIDDLKMYIRFLCGLRGYLSKRVSLDQAVGVIRRRLQEREKNFLTLVERAVFANSCSPYLPLFRYAGCDFADLQSMVNSQGLEVALGCLQNAGVYVSFEEFKGRKPIIRGDNILKVSHHNFDNPCLKNWYTTRSSGSSSPRGLGGTGSRTPVDLDYLFDRVPNEMFSYHVHDVLNAPQAIWYSPLPGGAGINKLLRQTCFNQKIDRWFTPLNSGDFKPALKFTLANWGILFMAGIFGYPLPRPEYLSVDKAYVLARWAKHALDHQGRCLLRTHAGMAARICLAALEDNIDLKGLKIMAGGEPLTDARKKHINDSGAKAIPIYSMSEAGTIARGCGDPQCDGNMHLFLDSFGFIQRPRNVPATGSDVGAFYLTSLLPSSPTILLNVETDDYGIVEEESCSCPFGQLGLSVNLRQIRSFSKFTADGVTLTESQISALLEQTLPEKFGGGPFDYQLVETEDKRGFAKLQLWISPQVRLPDQTVMRSLITDHLRQGETSADFARAAWERGAQFEIVRQEPVWSGQGKFPFLRRN